MKSYNSKRYCLIVLIISILMKGVRYSQHHMSFTYKDALKTHKYQCIMSQ